MVYLLTASRNRRVSAHKRRIIRSRTEARLWLLALRHLRWDDFGSYRGTLLSLVLDGEQEGPRSLWDIGKYTGALESGRVHILVLVLYVYPHVWVKRGTD